MIIREFYLNEEETGLYIEFSTKEDGDDFYRVLELSKPDIEYYSPTIIEDLEELDEDSIIDLIEEYGEIIKVKSKVDACRDKEDNFLLSLAKDGKSDYLITGDKDLLVIESFVKTKIISLTGFLEKFK